MTILLWANEDQSNYAKSIRIGFTLRWDSALHIRIGFTLRWDSALQTEEICMNNWIQGVSGGLRWRYG